MLGGAQLAGETWVEEKERTEACEFTFPWV